MAKLTPTSSPGIYRRHAKGCAGGRCDCSYVVVWRHRGRQLTETHRTMAEAREAKGNRDAGERRPVSRIGFEDYFRDWIESYAGRTQRGFAETSRAEYRRTIESLALPEWGTWKLSEIEAADVRNLFKGLRDKGISTVAIRRLRAALSAMFATAAEDGKLRSNPIRGIRIPASVDEPADEGPKALTRAELQALIEATPAQWRTFIEFLAHTGLRISEATGLTWRHLDLGDAPKVRVREQFYKGQRKRLKSREGRRDVRLSQGMTAKLLAHRRDTFQGDDSPVFGTPRGRELYPQNVAKSVLKPAARSVGLGWVTWHTFRHTCASLLFDEGRNVRQVAAWLGHADPAFTIRTYVHLMDEGAGDADFLDAVTAPGSTPGQQDVREQPQTNGLTEAAKTAH